MATDLFVIGPQQKVRFMAVARELRAVKTADCSASDHGNLHVLKPKKKAP
jgi:hypothetical protein